MVECPLLICMKALVYYFYLHRVYINVCICVCLVTHTSKTHTTQQCLSDVLSSCLHVQTHCPAHLMIYEFMSCYPSIFKPGGILFFVACTYDHEYHAYRRHHAVLSNFSRLRLKYCPHASAFHVSYQSAKTHCL